MCVASSSKRKAFRSASGHKHVPPYERSNKKNVSESSAISAANKFHYNLGHAPLCRVGLSLTSDFIIVWPQNKKLV